MGLFKDFKDDFSQAVNEMMPGADAPEKENKAEDLVVNTLGEDVDVKSELSKLDGLLEQVQKDGGSDTQKLESELPPIHKEDKKPVITPTVDPVINTFNEEKKIMSDTTMETPKPTAPVMNNKVNPDAVSDETSVITAGTINGNSAASEFFADVAKVEGEVVSSGTVKIGAGSVIIGNIAAASAVIAGAIKGDIDVQGPVVVDTSAVVMGNIKSRSVQINNGAVIEGFCSQCYADIDVQGLFDGK